MAKAIPPQNLEAEESVLGAMMVSEGSIKPVIHDARLRDEDFYRDRHRAIFRAIRALYERSEPVDALTVAEHLSQHDELADAGGKNLLTTLASTVPAPGNARHYAQIVKGHAVERAKRVIGTELTNGLAPADAIERLQALKAGPTLRTRGVLMERVRPIRWLWRRRIPLGLPSVVVGEEGVGKGTVMAWLIARATRGELDGDQEGEPINVLIVGDEDGFESVWVPRIYTAGGDLERLLTLDDGEYLDDLNARAEDLAVTVDEKAIGMIVLDQVLDHVNGGKDGAAIYNPKNVRQAMMPLRRVAGEFGIAATGLLHPIKGRAASFRDLIAGSHQFNAVSRSSLLLGVDPDERQRRILVRGKGNHSAAPRSFEFRIGVRPFELNGHDFEMPLVENATEGDRTIEDFVAGAPEAPAREALAQQLEPLLTDEPQKLASLAEAVNRSPKDGSVRRALKQLANDGRASQTNSGWIRAPAPETVPGATPLRGGTGTSEAWPLDDSQAEEPAP